MKWKRTIGWALAGLLVLLLIAAVGGYFYLRSNNFQQFALRKIVEQADLATGGRTEIGGLDFNLSTLTAHLYNITVRGTEGPDQPPLLHADELTVRVKILSALHHQVALRELLIDHPVDSSAGQPRGQEQSSDGAAQPKQQPHQCVRSRGRTRPTHERRGQLQRPQDSPGG